MTINTTNLTYRQLKGLVPEAPRAKMTAKKLEGEEVLFSEHVSDADITIYKNGYLKYTKYDLEKLKKQAEEADKQLAEGKISQEKYDQIQAEVKETEDKLKDLKAQSKACDEEFGHPISPEKWDALQREIIATEEELKKMAKEAANANTALNKMDSVGKTLENVGTKMTNTGRDLTRYVTTPIVGLGAAAIKTTADFDAQMSKVQAISGATGKEFDDLRAKAREMGAKTKFSASEAGAAFEYMAMAGWKTGDMLEGIEGIMNLAASSGEDLASTSDIVTDALTAFGLKAKDSGHFADVLAASSSNANTNVHMLGESFKYAAPVAGALGISAEDTAVALGVMANAGIKASQAGTALRTGLTNMAKPTKQMQQYMDKYNISLAQNDDGSINLRDTMIDLREKMGGLSESEQAAAAAAIFGKNAMAGWLAIINASDSDFNKLTGAIDNCDGMSQQMAETMQDNLAGQITILKSALQELAIQIGDALMPKIRDIVSAIQNFVLRLQKMDDGTRNMILRIAAFIAVLGPALIVIGALTTGVGRGLQAVSALGKGILTLKYQAELGVGAGAKLATAIGSITAPMVAVAAVIAVIVAAFVHLWKTNEDFRNKVTALWEGVKAKFAELGSAITEALNQMGFKFKSVTEVISAIWDAFCRVLAPALEAAFTIIAAVLQTALSLLTGLIQIFSGVFSGNWSSIWEGIKTIFSGIWDGIKVILTGALDALRSNVDTFLSIFGTNWNTVWTGIKSFFTGIWDGIRNFITTTQTGIQSTFSSIWSGVSGNISSVWETIKSIVQVGLLTIENLISAAFQLITLPFRFWEPEPEEEDLERLEAEYLERVKNGLEPMAEELPFN